MPGAEIDRITGAGGRTITLREKANFTFHAVGEHADGSPGLEAQSATAWVLPDDQLSAGCLLGNERMRPRHPNFDLSTNRAICPNARDFSIPFIPVKNAPKTVVWKVTALKKTTLDPGQSALVLVDYVNLAKGRLLSFTSTHPGATNCLPQFRTSSRCTVRWRSRR